MVNRLAAIQRAQEITDQVFSDILQFIKPGVSEKQVATKLRRLIHRHGGAQKLAFPPLVCSGPRTAKFHGPTSQRKIKTGDTVFLDFGARYRGFCADMTRTIFVGKPKKRLLKIYKIVKNVQERQIKLVKAGAKAATIDLFGRKLLAKQHLEKYFTHSTGHGIGLNVHQLPRVSKKSKAVLKAGQVITIEPGVYINGLGGVRIEDMIVVKKHGYLNITKSTKEIVIINNK